MAEKKLRGLLIGTADYSPSNKTRLLKIQDIIEQYQLNFFNPVLRYSLTPPEVPNYQHLKNAAFGIGDLTRINTEAFISTFAEVVTLSSRDVPVVILYSKMIYEDELIRAIKRFKRAGSETLAIQSYRSLEHRHGLVSRFAQRVITASLTI